MDELATVQSRFVDRIRAARPWSAVAYRAARFPLALLLAVLPAVVLLLAAWLGPEALAKAVTETRNVHDTFARFVSAVATASAIAVSVATLTLGRELKGIGKQEERHETNDEYRERIRQTGGLQRAPLAIGPFLAAALLNVRDAARRARRAAGEAAARTRVGDVDLGQYLDAVEVAAERSSNALRRAGPQPHRIASRALDFEEEVTTQLLRNFRRAEGLGPETETRLAELEQAIDDVILGAKYVKTLDIQWGFSRMAQAITVTSLPAIVVSAGMVLAYGEGAVDALGRMGAVGLVAAALVVALLPMACFASYVLRFVFLNEHTLPTDSFVLGPESPSVVKRESAGGKARRAI